MSRRPPVLAGTTAARLGLAFLLLACSRPALRAASADPADPGAAAAAWIQSPYRHFGAGQPVASGRAVLYDEAADPALKSGTRRRDRAARERALRAAGLAQPLLAGGAAARLRGARGIGRSQAARGADDREGPVGVARGPHRRERSSVRGHRARGLTAGGAGDAARVRNRRRLPRAGSRRAPVGSGRGRLERRRLDRGRGRRRRLPVEAGGARPALGGRGRSGVPRSAAPARGVGARGGSRRAADRRADAHAPRGIESAARTRCSCARRPDSTPRSSPTRRRRSCGCSTSKAARSMRRLRRPCSVRHRTLLPETEASLKVSWPPDGGAGAAVVRYRDTALPPDVVFFAAGDRRTVPLAGVARVDWLVAGSSSGGGGGRRHRPRSRSATPCPTRASTPGPTARRPTVRA